jgi:CRP/FNR family cyclic AMP-dependent transcriptional regulator
VSQQGKEAVVALHGEGDFFGEGCLTGQPLRLATVSAMTDCVIMRTDMVGTLRDEPKLSEVFMAYILARNARVVWSISFLTRAKGVWRECFWLMANFGKEGKPEPAPRGRA